MPLSRNLRRAIRKYGPVYDREARSRYGVSGEDLLSKLVIGESGGRKNAVSSAGARSFTQFMPGTRQIAIQKFGVDPWRSADEAVHAAVLHLQGKLTGNPGLEGYNPGDPNYPKYILSRDAPHFKAGGTKSNINLPTTEALNNNVESKEVFDKKGYQKALRGTYLARLLSNRPEGSVLLRTGLLSTAMPERSEFVSTVAGRRLKGATPSVPGMPARRPSTSLSGRVTWSGANPGRVTPATKTFAQAVANVAGMDITADTGATHSKYTVNGNVSQHWTGDATDIPATGKKLLKLGRAALIAAGMPRKEAMRQKGGLYNVRGKQIIFLTNEGGNHYNHLHIGI